jgi:hypothetical protein
MADFEEKREPKQPVTLNSIFGNTELMRGIRTTVSILISIALPIAYFGFFVNLDQFTPELVFQLSGLGVVSMLSIWNIRFEIATRAAEDEIAVNKDIIRLNEEINAEKVKIKNHELGVQFATQYNRDARARRDAQATQTRLESLAHKLLVAQVKGRQKRAKRLSARIESLKSKPLNLWWIRIPPIKFSDIYEIESHRSSKETPARSKLRYNPKYEGAVKSMFSSVLKSVGFGSMGTIPFLIGTPFMTILIFYGFLLSSMAWTAVTTYLKIRYKTQTKYVDARTFKRDLLRQCVAFIAEKEKAMVPAKEPEVENVEVEDIETVILPKVNLPIHKQPTA